MTRNRHGTSEPPVTVTLPGQVAYKNKNQRCRLAPFSLYDVKEMTNAVNANDRDQIDTIIQRRCSMSIYQLLEPDYVFVQYWLRKHSYESWTFNSIWVCGFCSVRNTTPLPVDYDNLREDYGDGVTIRFSSGEKKVRLPLYGDQRSISEALKREPYNALSKKDLSTEYDVMQLACMLEPSGGTLEERMDVVYAMTADDAWKFSYFQKDYAFGVKQAHTFECSKCGKSNEVHTAFGPGKFLPGDFLSEPVGSGIYADNGSRVAS